MEKQEILHLDSVRQYNDLYGFETLHPLVTVVDLTHEVEHMPLEQTINYGLYALWLKESRSCDVQYGRQTYDYEEGTIMCFAPGQTVHTKYHPENGAPRCHGLLFHPDLLRGTNLGRTIRQYTFFSYSVHEALHTSEQERDIVMDCLRKIRLELERSIDKHSRQIIAMNIELLLGYCMRFYERQFITREVHNLDTLTKFEELLDAYFEGNNAARNGLPTVRYFADHVYLSPNYFGDLIKKETGRTPQEYIQQKVIDMAKQRIADSHETVSEISYSLGFRYPQHLCRLFKKRVGVTPQQYRKQMAS